MLKINRISHLAWLSSCLKTQCQLHQSTHVNLLAVAPEVGCSIGLTSQITHKPPLQAAQADTNLHLGVKPINVNPGLINLWLMNRGGSPFSGDSSLLEGPPPSGTGLLILGQHYLSYPGVHTLVADQPFHPSAGAGSALRPYPGQAGASKRKAGEGFSHSRTPDVSKAARCLCSHCWCAILFVPGVCQCIYKHNNITAFQETYIDLPGTQTGLIRERG